MPPLGHAVGPMARMEIVLSVILVRKNNNNLEGEIMKNRITTLALCLLFTIPMLFGGCADMTAAQKGAVGGGAAGAIAGQIIGGNTKATLIGAGVGALGGALINDELKKNK